MRNCFLLIAILAVTILMVPQAQARQGKPVSGSAEFIFGEYHAEERGGADFDASYFGQQYSVSYEMAGKIAEGRAGSYDLALGYEWTSLDRDLNGDDRTLTRDKVLYNGDVVIAPGGVPFRLTLFARDMNPSRFQDGNPRSLFNLDEVDLPVAGPLIDIFNGTHHTMGGTLFLGIKNGSYLGKYRDIMSRLPRLLIDYREDNVKDVKGSSPRHYRQRNLAFVSLNKKENWLHYRVIEYTNFLNALDNFEERNVLLGTIDHNLQRKWIDITNWIQVSADVAFTDHVSEARNNPFERFDLNLFVAGQRGKVEARSFSNFSRRLDTNTQLLEKNLEVPLYMKGEPSRNTAWRLKMITAFEEENSFVSGVNTRDDNLFVSGQMELFRQQRHIVVPRFSAEINRGDFGDGEAFLLGVESYTNREFRPKYDLYGSYSVAQFSGKDGSGFDSDFIEHVLRGKVETDVTGNLRAGLEQELVYGSGDLNSSVTVHTRSASGASLGLSSDSLDSITGHSFRSLSRWFAEHEKNRLSNRIQVEYEYLTQPDANVDRLSVSHLFSYNRRPFSVSIRNSADFGEDLSSGASPTDGISGQAGTGPVDSQFLSAGSLTYLPNRSREMRFDYKFEWFNGTLGDSHRLELEQEYRHRFFHINGVVRELGNLSAGIVYDFLDQATGDSAYDWWLKCGGNYFPTARSYIGTLLRYNIDREKNADTWVAHAQAGIKYSKFELGLEYTYGDQIDTDGVHDRQEERWEVKIKKIF